MNNDGIDQLFNQLRKLVDESRRRFDDANHKVSKYMLKRVKSFKGSICLLNAIDQNLKKDIDQEKLSQLTEIEVLLQDLLSTWEDKLQSCTNGKHNFTRYHAIVSAPNNSRGRPALQIDFEQVKLLREYHFTWEKIASILGIHRSTLYRRLQKENLDFELAYTNITDEELDKEIADIKKNHPLAGERMMIGFLRGKNYHLQRQRVRDSIHRVDPVNAINRWLQKNPRCIYSVPGPNSLWHNDGLHKLIHWGIVIHACIDGFSRMITSLLCATNNYSSTTLMGFLRGVKEFGLPARVRGDKGGENTGILNFMREKQGYDGAYIQGPSVHNQRIERLHYDTTHCVLSHFIDLFKYLEEHSLLARDNLTDLFALQFVYVPRIQQSLDNFKEGWNHHQLSTEKNQSPYQLWLMGMMDENRSSQRGVRMVLENAADDSLFGIDPSPSLNAMPSDSSIVEVHDISFDRMEFVTNHIKESFDPFFDDGNFGIDLYISIKECIENIL